MEIRELRYFVAACRERHFGRAAQALFISQPSPSHTIKQLENQRGVRLLERHSRGVDITAAGAVEKHRVGHVGTLRIGYQASGVGSVITAMRAAFADKYPEVRIQSRRYDWGQEVAALRSGEVDISVVWQPQDLVGLASSALTTEQRYIALPVGHPLAERSSLSSLDVKDISLTWTRQAPAEWVAWWAVDPRPDGSRAVSGAENRNVEEQLDNAASGCGAAISPESMTTFCRRPDLRWIPLHDVEPLRIDLAWNPQEPNPLVSEFIEVADQFRDIRR